MDNIILQQKTRDQIRPSVSRQTKTRTMEIADRKGPLDTTLQRLPRKSIKNIA